MKKIILLIFISIVVNAQYTENDTLLLRETFKRNFNHHVFEDYYKSNDDQKVNAWLVSISHSEDTSFVQNIIKLNFKEHAEYICFALGQLGKCSSSSKYLLNKVFDKTLKKYERFCLEAFGKVADSVAFNKLIDKYFDKKINNFDGISIAIADYTRRNFDNKKIPKVLLEELNDYKSIRSKTEALYALSRYKVTDLFYEKLVSYLSKNDLTNENILNYTLKCFAKLKQFPNNKSLINHLIKSKYWTVRTEASKVIPFVKDPEDSGLVKLYLQLLEDKNINVRVQAAISSSLFNYLNKDIREFLIKSLTSKLKRTNSENLADALFISICKLNTSVDFISLRKNTRASDNAFFIGINKLSIKANEKFEILKNRLELTDKSALLTLVSSLMNLQNELLKEQSYSDLLFKLLYSDNPAVISIISDNLNKEFISNYNSELKSVVRDLIEKHLNDAQYMESILSLYNLSKRISPEYLEVIKPLVSESKLYSIRKLVDGNSKKDGLVFNELKDYLFSYKSAIINTSAGSFRIEFSNEYAPVSVANFCYLSEKGFYNEVKFHRVVPNFVIQTGDPDGTGWGGPGYEICSEFSFNEFRKGAVGMASAGKDTEGSQWFVMHSYYPHLNRNYTNFGNVTKGIKVVNQIKQWDKIYSIELIK